MKPIYENHVFITNPFIHLYTTYILPLHSTHPRTFVNVNTSFGTYYSILLRKKNSKIMRLYQLRNTTAKHDCLSRDIKNLYFVYIKKKLQLNKRSNDNTIANLVLTFLRVKFNSHCVI